MTNLSINLASEPFRRDRPMIVIASALAIVLVCTLGLLIWLPFSEGDELKETRLAIEKARTQVEAQQREQAQLEGALRRPENAEVLERNVFLNLLLLRKGISWTRIFSDLESVIPYNVKLISIRPQVAGQNDVQLDMIVAAQAAEPVLEMLMKLENSPLFGGIALSTSLPPSQTEPLFRYRVAVNYAQKL